MRFRAKRTFVCAATGSTYVEGLQYTVRPGNDALAARVANWIKEGKVESDMQAAASISGTDKGLIARLLDKLPWR